MIEVSAFHGYTATFDGYLSAFVANICSVHVHSCICSWSILQKNYNYGHELVITDYFYEIIHSRNEVIVLRTGKGP